jgi:hypothetical protein
MTSEGQNTNEARGDVRCCGYSSNNRGIVGNDVFCSVRAKWEYKKGASELVFQPHVEAGSNTSTMTLRVVGGDEKGSLKCETVKYGRKSQGTRTRETLRWRIPAAIINDRPILPLERMLHKDYNRKCSVRKLNYCVVSVKGLGAKTNWLAVNLKL